MTIPTMRSAKIGATLPHFSPWFGEVQNPAAKEKTDEAAHAFLSQAEANDATDLKTRTTGKLLTDATERTPFGIKY